MKPYNYVASVRRWSGRPVFNLRSSHTKDSKMVRDAAYLSTQNYKVRIKARVEYSRVKSNAPRTPLCINHLKGSHQVSLDYGWQLFDIQMNRIFLDRKPKVVLIKEE